MQGGGGLIYEHNRRTDGAAWVAARVWGMGPLGTTQRGKVGVRLHGAEEQRQWVP
jgi:hypothetical protein